MEGNLASTKTKPAVLTTNRPHVKITTMIAIIIFHGIALVMTIIRTIIPSSPPTTITDDQKQAAIATIDFRSEIGIDAAASYHYYIFPNRDRGYYYLESGTTVTIAGPQSREVTQAPAGGQRPSSGHFDVDGL